MQLAVFKKICMRSVNERILADGGRMAGCMTCEAPDGFTQVAIVTLELHTCNAVHPLL